jgi:hypothetical protein
MAASYAAGYIESGYTIIAPRIVMDLIPQDAREQQATIG